VFVLSISNGYHLCLVFIFNPQLIDSWNQLEQKFHAHFFSGNYQLKLTDLTSVKQGKDETDSNYLKRFKEVKNHCFNLSISDSDLANLAAKGLKSTLRKRLEGVNFYSLDSILVRGMAQELKLNKEKEKLEPHQFDVHVVDYVSNLNNETEVYSAEFVWPSEDKSFSCASLKPASKGRQEELRFTFDVSYCDRIFDELLKLENIKISHTMPPFDEIKRHAYCKYQHSYSHATNDCNVFRRQIQSAINEGRLVLYEKHGDKHPFSINTMELQQPKVLVWPHQVEATKGKNAVVGEAKPDLRGKELTREVAYEKTPDGRETLKIIVKASGLGGQGSSTPVSRQPLEPEKAGAVKPAGVGGQTALPMVAQRCLFQSDWRLEVGTSMWQKIRGMLQSQRSHLTCYLTITPNKNPLQAIGR
jgi:hypothetical protein